MLVNKSLTASKEIVFKLAKSISSVKEIEKTNAEEVVVSIHQQNKTITSTFLPGEGKLFVLN